MTNESFQERERERARRLREYVQGELREMWVEARMDFAADLIAYLLPEIQVLMKQHRIGGVNDPARPQGR